MLPDTVRLSQPTKEQLVRLKRSTGIKQWNVLCRWALCTSLADPRELRLADDAPMSNVEMTWKVFAGPQGHTYAALLAHDGNRRAVAPGDLVLLLQAHIRRGVSMLLLSESGIAGLLRGTQQPA